MTESTNTTPYLAQSERSLLLQMSMSPSSSSVTVLPSRSLPMVMAPCLYRDRGVYCDT